MWADENLEFSVLSVLFDLDTLAVLAAADHQELLNITDFLWLDREVGQVWWA